MSNTDRKAWTWLWLSVVVIVLDQFSKYLAVQYLSFREPVAIYPFFNLTLNYNPGAAFGILGMENGWKVFLLSGISIIVSAALIGWLSRVKRSDWLMALPISLILGGALGNLIDRIRLHYVIDFFDFHIGQWHYATFNLADSAICVGAFLLIVGLLVRKR